ncbi:MAG: hypothetical protein ACK2T2_09280, partial [Anaerolineales bacterium]
MKFRLYVPILISLSTLLLAACGAASPQSPTPSAATETPTVMPAQLAHISPAAAGVALFEQDCTPCH